MPHAASTSIERMIRHQCKRLAKKHSFDVPAEYSGWKTVTTVRNPYPRLVSMWWWYCFQPQRPHDLGKMQLAEFLELAMESSNRLLKCQWEVCGGRQPGIVLRYEELPDNLYKLLGDSCNRPLHRLHHLAPQRKPWQTYYNKEIITLANKHSAPDFRRFGYDHLAQP